MKSKTNIFLYVIALAITILLSSCNREYVPTRVLVPISGQTVCFDTREGIQTNFRARTLGGHDFILSGQTDRNGNFSFNLPLYSTEWGWQSVDLVFTRNGFFESTVGVTSDVGLTRPEVLMVRRPN